MRRALLLVGVVACAADDDEPATADGAPAGVDASPGVASRFAREIAPILDARCASCHGATAPVLGLTLGPSSLVPAREIVAGIVGVAASEAPGLALVEPGDPLASYLYRKIADDLAAVSCPQGCQSRMPPAGAPLSSAELTTIRDWIADGATEDLP